MEVEGEAGEGEEVRSGVVLGEEELRGNKLTIGTGGTGRVGMEGERDPAFRLLFEMEVVIFRFCIFRGCLRLFSNPFLCAQ